VTANDADSSTDITLSYDLPEGTYAWIVTEDEFGDFDECGSDKGNAYTFTYGLLPTGIEATSGSAGNGDVSYPAAEGPTTYDEE